MSAPDPLQFEQELIDLIQKFEAHTELHAEPYMVAAYLIACLENFRKFVTSRDQWPPHGVEKSGS